MTDGGIGGETSAQKAVVESVSVSAHAILQALDAQAAEVRKAMAAAGGLPEISPAQILDLQFQISLFGQLSETATSVLSSFNDVVAAAARNIK